jgi:outer membrane protein assembly factor BamB
MKNLAASLSLIFSALAAAQNWPSFRGPNATGIADGQDPPAAWDATKSVNVRWKTAIPGLGHSSPVVWGDRVFVTTAISSDPKSEFTPGAAEQFEPAKDVSPHTWRVYCLDKRTGKILWERTAHQGVPKSKRHPTSSQANSTPATDGQRLAVFFGSEGLFAYDYNGKLLWKQDVGIINPGFHLDPDFEWGAGSSPILYKNLVILQCDNQKDSFLAAYDLRDGKPVWRVPRDEPPSWGTPAVHTGRARPELVANGRIIRGYDPLTGKELWRLATKADVTVGTPVVAGDLIFITDGWMNQPFHVIHPGATGDISLKDGALSNDYVAWSKNRGGQWYIQTPIVYADLLYTVSQNGILACYNAKTGERHYYERLGGKGGGYTASPVAADGKLYFTSQDGEIFVVKTGPKYELLAANPMGEVCMATPAISEGMIFVRTQKHLYGIGKGK